MQITRRIEFDAGHRIPFHDSKCRNLHGHRYVLEATLEGPIKPPRQQSDDGMVQDFGELKAIMLEHVHDVWDHGLILWSQDPLAPALSDLLHATGMNLNKLILVPVPPTAEHLAQLAFDCLQPVLDDNEAGIKLVTVTLYETPNSRAVITRS